MSRRSTIQRSLVLDAVKELRGHVTANEVYDAVVQKYPDISRATVYRNLKLLSDIGEIRKVEMLNGADRYDYQCHSHYHARCDTCNRVFDVDMDVIPDLEKRIQDFHGFRYTGYDIIFKGLCRECHAESGISPGKNQ